MPSTIVTLGLYPFALFCSAVMTYCQIHAIRAVLYQCYTNARKLVDVATMKAFMPVLESTPVRDIIKVSV